MSASPRPSGVVLLILDQTFHVFFYFFVWLSPRPSGGIFLGFIDRDTVVNKKIYPNPHVDADTDNYDSIAIMCYLNYVGGGTALFAFTATIGWKHYYRKSKLSISSIFCGQKITHLGFSGYMPTVSLASEYRWAKRALVKYRSRIDDF